MSGQSHHSDPRVLDRRTLERDHRRLADLVCPGMSVLDVGCGTGAITAGIARRVGLEGRALGIDRDEELLARARQNHQGVPQLKFENCDITCLSYENCFDIVTAARTLQWVARPDRAIEKMKNAAKTEGCVLVLDYSHERNFWRPEPPVEFRVFYQAFLDWRKANGWDNQIADRLPELFRAAGLEDIRTFIEDEVVQRDDPEFLNAAAIWSRVIETIGPQIVKAEFLADREVLEVEQRYQQWTKSGLQEQTLYLRAVFGRVSGRSADRRYGSF